MKARTILLAALMAWPFFGSAEADVIVIEMSAPVLVYDVSDPNFSWGRSASPPQVVDAKKLEAIDGAGPPDHMAEYLADGSAREQALAKIVSGGELKLSYARSKAHLSARVTYQASRKLNSDEIEALREYTYGQLLDGVGESFQQAYARRPGRFWIAFEDIEYDELRATPSER